MASVLIVAAGRGTRAQSDIPKQYIEIGGKTILRHTIDRFLALPDIDQITVVIAKADKPVYSEALNGLEDPRITQPVVGGDTRAKSVRAGLEAMAKSGPPQHVLIHDAARPFVSPVSVAQVLEVLKIHDGAMVATPAVDALWRTDGGFAISPQDRNMIYHAQTPQGFRFSSILNAHRTFKGEAADDAVVARSSGMLVQIVPGTPENFKITTRADIARARAYLALPHAAKDT